MTTVNALGPKLALASAGLQGASLTNLSANRTGYSDDTAELKFGSAKSKAPGKSSHRIVPIVGPLLAGAAALLLLPFKALCAVKGCLISCCIGAVALGALLGLTLFK